MHVHLCLCTYACSSSAELGTAKDGEDVALATTEDTANDDDVVLATTGGRARPNGRRAGGAVWRALAVSACAALGPLLGLYGCTMRESCSVATGLLAPPSSGPEAMVLSASPVPPSAAPLVASTRPLGTTGLDATEWLGSCVWSDPKSLQAFSERYRQASARKWANFTYTRAQGMLYKGQCPSLHAQTPHPDPMHVHLYMCTYAMPRPRTQIPTSRATLIMLHI